MLFPLLLVPIRRHTRIARATNLSACIGNEEEEAVQAYQFQPAEFYSYFKK